MWKKLMEAVWELLYPPRQACPLCGGASAQAAVCSACGLLLAQYAQEDQCQVCGLYGVPSDGCPYCRAKDRTFLLARSAGPYEGPLREAVHRLKYRGRKDLVRPLAMLMAQVAQREPAFTRTQGLVPVPLFPLRQRQRGFNQAVLLARELETFLKAPVLEGVVVKVRSTPPQTGLSRRVRLQNLQHAFAVTTTQPVVGKIITIVDDVFTTGTTVSTISQLLRQAGAESVLVLTLAGARYYGRK